MGCEFRGRLSNGQTLGCDFKGFDVPYVAEGKGYYAGGADMITVMGMAPDEAIREAVDGAIADQKEVAFDLMTYADDDFKVQRARQLVDLGANLISCHTGWSKQAVGKTPDALIGKVCQAGTLGCKEPQPRLPALCHTSFHFGARKTPEIDASGAWRVPVK